ncbi:MAG TPA: DegT/DnrJ/EryC1/StrS aminotransferase family protein [Sedimenticola thiotaurini]|uniref:DegT/DnrJ/EryC1/StrS aminotransferase family protein n=1 Tax=Sedimenticola thiotaurini TaxID=1543721 RepID=A0A831RLT1_9GAMM|nr:DegT/DnrJ/EryC1/StrS aminotransferase family protein [Sedimenticola thiotaurini]
MTEIDRTTAGTPSLACHGGVAVRSRAFPPWPHYDEDEIGAVAGVLRSGRVNYLGGEQGDAFEREFAGFCQAEYAVALANGTLALELALRALGVGQGDEVIVTARSFIASASCIVMNQAVPVFCDVDADTQNVTATTLAPLITPRTRAIIAVHLAGMPCDMDPIMELADEHGILVVEDCAQAHGARYRGRPVGGIGHAAAFSFCQDKIISTGGEGGMLLTSDEQVWHRAWSFKDHGKNREKMLQRGHPPGFRWLHDSIGSNWRMTEMQAAIGRLQLARLPDWLQRRQRNAERLRAALQGIPCLRIPPVPAYADPAWYKFYLFVRPERLRSGWDRDAILQAVVEEGVPCFTGSCPEIYREGAFRDGPYCPDHRLPVARRLGEESLMFPVHPTLADDDMDDMARALRKVLAVAGKGGLGG